MANTQQKGTTSPNLNKQKTGNESEKSKEKEQQYREETYRQPKCNFRIEELAKPKKNLVYAMYTHFKTILPKPNSIAVKQYLQEEYAKNTEDIEEYFTKLKNIHDDKHSKKLSKLKARKKDIVKRERKLRQKMLINLKEILKKTLFNAYMNPKQIIMTSMLRKMSNKILKELCHIRHINVPSREDNSVRAEFMFAICDWFAYCIEAIYYEMQVQKVRDYEELKMKMETEDKPNEEKVNNIM